MYRTVDTAFWTDPKVRQLSKECRYLLLYFITNTHTHISGIYYLPRAVISHETGVNGYGIDTLCDTLSSSGFCAFDREREIVWVKNMMRYQGRGEKHIKSAARHLVEDLHKSPLTHEFVDAYPEVKREIDDRVSKGYPGLALLIPNSQVLIPNSQILNPDSDKSAKSKTIQKKTCIPDDFVVTQTMIVWASDNGFSLDDVELESPAFIDHFKGSGVMKLDWVATWRNWMRRSKTFHQKPNRIRSKAITEFDHPPPIDEDDPEYIELREWAKTKGVLND